MLTSKQFALRSLLLSVLTFLSISAALAQSANNGSVLGVVADTTGAAISGASISLRNTQNGNVLTATTNSEGNYGFQVVPAGEYDLTTSKDGFKQNTHAAFAVHASEHVRIDVALSVGAITETVTVSATPPVVDTILSLIHI